MPNNKWDDDHIENLLRDFPAIKDERPKEEVYKRLKHAHEPPKKTRHWIPYLVAALAFITFGVLLASMLGQNSDEGAFETGSSGGTEETADTSSTAMENNAESEGGSAEMESTEAADSGQDSESFNSMGGSAVPGASSIYADELGDQTLFTIGLTENALVIPVSFIISNDRLLEDFGTADVDAVELYNRYAAGIDEEALGFDEYHPYSGTVKGTSDGIEHVLPEEHDYDMASAAMSVYFNSLSVSFRDAAEISVVDENGEPKIFDQAGPVEPFQPAMRNIAYYSYTVANGDTYLVPGFNMPYENAAEALNAMKSSSSDLFRPVIPSGVDYAVAETEQSVAVEFSDTIDFNSYSPEEALRMIEGMVLTADSFGKELVFSNTAASGWDRFDFTEPLPVPAGINTKILE